MFRRQLSFLIFAAITIGILVMLSASLMFAQAERTILNERGTWVDTQTIPCVGTLHLTFKNHEVITERWDANEGYHWTSHFNIAELYATDDFGNEYVGQQNINESFHCGLDCVKPVEHSVTYTIRIEGKGQAPNLLLKLKIKVVINANGKPTVDMSILDIQCHPK